MDTLRLAENISEKRKALGLTQQNIAEKLGISFQAVSKWEQGTACPDIMLLPHLASILGMTIDGLLGYPARSASIYEERYKTDDYYWGLKPNDMCYDIMKILPPTKPYRVLDIGCGEGKDAVFLAKNGYIVTAFDVTQSGIDKARALADKSGVHIDLFKADIRDWLPDEQYDIIYSSGVFTYLPEERRKLFTDSLKEHTPVGGLCALNVFVEKPFIEPAPDENSEYFALWKSGELFGYYHDWQFLRNDEFIFDCLSGGVPHKHCMDVLIAEKMI